MATAPHAGGIHTTRFDATGFEATGLNATGLETAGFDATGSDATGSDATGSDATGARPAGNRSAGSGHDGIDSRGTGANGPVATLAGASRSVTSGPVATVAHPSRAVTAAGTDRRLAEAGRLAAPVAHGTVVSTQGLRAVIGGLSVAVGDVVRVGGAAGMFDPSGAAGAAGPAGVEAEVVAVNRTEATVMPLADGWAPSAGTPVTRAHRGSQVPVGDGLIGRVIDALGRPIDGRGPLTGVRLVSPHRAAPHALDRAPVAEQLGTGVRAVDTFTALGRGQRIGLFAGSGVGKSSLLSMIARGTDAEVSVIALVGERGREVRGFLDDDLGPEGLARSVVVVATGDEPAMMRRKAAFTATRIAEQFRDEGRHAVLMMDSLTRVAMAQREIGLSAGEPPATRGYPPSTFSLLAQLLERAGTDRAGSVTGIYTVLVDGDDHNDPVADSARSILDGHLVLERRLAVAGHFPSIDVLASISRCASAVTAPADKAAITAVRRAMAEQREVQDLIDVGAYVPGTRPLADAALAARGPVDEFLRQGMDDSTTLPEAWARLGGLARLMEAGPVEPSASGAGPTGAPTTVAGPAGVMTTPEGRAA